MSHSEDQLWDLLREGYELPPGPAQIALTEQVMAHADAQGLAELAYEARMLATRAYTYGGEPAKSFVTFAWCLAEYDRDPVTYGRTAHTLLWYFKNMVTGILKFPEIGLDRAYAVLDDMERRWRAGGHSLHAVYAYRHRVARHLGDREAAAQWYERWCTAPRDDLSDCVGCDPGGKAEWLAGCGRDEEAIALTEPVLAGRLTCTEQPQTALTTLLQPYLRTGRLDQARDAHRRAYRLHRPRLADLADIGTHLYFCAVTGNAPRGLEILERHLPWLDRAPSPSSAMYFAAAAGLVLRRAAESGPVTVHRPAHGDRPDAGVDAATLGVELAAFATGLAARFDARNGTAYQGERIASVLAAEPMVEYLPLVARPARRTVTTPPVPAPPPTVAALPAGAGPDEYLDLAEADLRRHDRDSAYATFHAFDERYADTDLSALQRARRAEGHAMEQAYGDDHPAAEVAWHSAADLYGQAGEELLRQVASARLGLLYCADGRGGEGLPLVERACAYVCEHGDRDRWCGVLQTLASAYAETGRPDEALVTLARAEPYAADSLDPYAAAQVCVDRARYIGMAGDPEGSRRAARHAIEVCREAGYPDGIALGYVLVAYATEYAGDAEAALAAYDQALAAVREPAMVRRIRQQRALILIGGPRAAEAIEDLAEVVADRTARGDRPAAAEGRYRLAVAYLNAGRPLDCAEVAEEAVAWYDANHDPMAAEVRHLLSVAYQRLGQPDEAIAALEGAQATRIAAGDWDRAGRLTEEIADLLDRLDRDAAAGARYTQAAQAYERADQPADRTRALRRAALSYGWANQPEPALAALAEAVAAAGRIPPGRPAVFERATVQYDAARVKQQVGRLDEAVGHARQAAQLYRGLDAQREAAYVDGLLARLYLARGDPRAAEAAARRALADLPADAPGRPYVAEVLVEALEAQDRSAEAAQVRRELGLV